MQYALNGFPCVRFQRRLPLLSWLRSGRVSIFILRFYFPAEKKGNVRNFQIRADCVFVDFVQQFLWVFFSSLVRSVSCSSTCSIFGAHTMGHGNANNYGAKAYRNVDVKRKYLRNSIQDCIALCWLCLCLCASVFTNRFSARFTRCLHATPPKLVARSAKSKRKKFKCRKRFKK